MERATYRVATKTFIEPNLIPEGTVIYYDGPPGPHLIPLNDKAREVYATWVRDNPQAQINPVDSLPMTMGDRPTAEIVSAAPAPVETAFGNLAQPGKATPGPTEVGGGILTQELLDALARNGIRPNAGSLGNAVQDGPGMGSNAPSVEGALEPEKVMPAMTRPLPGDPTKPGEGEGVKEAGDEKRAADLKATVVAQEGMKEAPKEPLKAPAVAPKQDPSTLKIKE